MLLEINTVYKQSEYWETQVELEKKQAYEKKKNNTLFLQIVFLFAFLWNSQNQSKCFTGQDTALGKELMETNHTRCLELINLTFL